MAEEPGKEVLLWNVTHVICDHRESKVLILFFISTDSLADEHLRISIVRNSFPSMPVTEDGRLKQGY